MSDEQRPTSKQQRRIERRLAESPEFSEAHDRAARETELEELRAIAYALSRRRDPVIYGAESGYCGVCFGGFGEHQPDCAWLAALRWASNSEDVTLPAFHRQVETPEFWEAVEARRAAGTHEESLAIAKEYRRERAGRAAAELHEDADDE